MLGLEEPCGVESEAHLLRNELRKYDGRTRGVADLRLRVCDIETHELQFGWLNGEALIEKRRCGSEISCFNTVSARRGARNHRDLVETHCICGRRCRKRSCRDVSAGCCADRRDWIGNNECEIRLRRCILDVVQCGVGIRERLGRFECALRFGRAEVTEHSGRGDDEREPPCTGNRDYDREQEQKDQ